MKVLVVDDKKNDRRLLCKLLTSNDYEVAEASNGIEALESIKASKPNLIISDIMMPGMDGFTLLRELKKDNNTKDIPIVFYTAYYVSEKDRELADKLGASRYIIKPAEPTDLIEEIAAVLSEYEAGLLKPAASLIRTEEEYLKQYSERLLEKLEEKLRELEGANEKLRHEIEERRRAEGALRESEARMRSVFEQANDGIYIISAENRYLDANERGLELLGYTHSELMQLGVADVLAPHEVARLAVDHRR